MKSSIQEYNIKIKKLRQIADLDLALETTKLAINDYPSNNFYYKLSGDILFQQKKYSESYKYYLIFLQYIDDRYDLYKNFIKYYQRLRQNDCKSAQELVNELMTEVDSNKYSLQVRGWISKYFDDFADVNPNIDEIIQAYNKKSNREFEIIIKEKLTNNDNIMLNAFLGYCLKNSDRKKTWQKDKFLISVFEKNNRLRDAIILSTQLIEIKEDPIVIRSLFRICRTIDDYSASNLVIEQHNSILNNNDFNILYELFYYYRYYNNTPKVELVLTRIKRAYKESIPILKTLYNFYLQCGYISDAKEIQKNISALSAPQKNNNNNDIYISKENSLIESEQNLFKSITNLFEEQEHNRKMIAIQDLLKGFSHEMGQPITNIRYSIQLYEMKKERNKILPEDTELLLTKIMKQTERLGHLLKRFTPIVSSTNANERFIIKDRFIQVFSELENRFDNINTSISGDSSSIVGDPIQFDQIIYNLTLNAIQAINLSNKNNQGLINVKITETNKFIKVIFEDNGAGIEKQNEHKIFEPFFTTKDPTSGEGGEGLGLYIIWNIVKIFKGNIRLDTTDNDKTIFVLKFKKGE